MLRGRTRQGFLKRSLQEIRESLKYFVFAAIFIVAMLGVFLSSLIPHYEQVEDQIVALADAHLRYESIHSGWSFPGRIWSAPATLDQPKERLLEHARLRGYEEICPAELPGQICPETGEVVVRGGLFAEGQQPDENGDWTRPMALEPVLLGWMIGTDGEIREHLPIEDAPQRLLSAIIAAEDDAFYDHRGVNYKGAARAALANIRGGGFDQGASTITMQVVRAITQEREKTMARKFREAASAIALDEHLGKDQILQIYLDAPYLGQYGSFSVCGFQAAARYYYGVDAIDLSLSQAATLAAILPAPARYSPIDFPERARQQRDRVLRRMRSLGWNPTEVKEALQEPIIAFGFKLPEPRYPAYMQATRSWLEAHLSPTEIHGLGLQVFTALDLVAQERGDAALEEGISFLTANLDKRFKVEEALQASAAVLDSESGLLVAVHGGEVELATDFNRATQAMRQAGSSLKPLVYALAFSQLNEEGLPSWKANDTMANYRRVFENTDGWKPRNLGEYTPKSTLAYGLAMSQNIATANLLEELGGPEPLIEFAQKFGFDTSTWKKEMGLALGQAEVTPLSMSRFVATILREGELASGSPVVLARNIRGEVPIRISENNPQVLTAESAALTRDLMRLVVEAGTGGPIRGVAGRYGFRQPTIGKTGTTDSEKDLWFVGGSATYTAGLWLGYDQPSRVGSSSSDIAAPLWGWWARAVHEGLEEKELSGMENPRRTICTITGHRPNQSCKGIRAPFLEGTQPSTFCPMQHPPPDPDKKYRGMWARKAEARERAREEAAVREAVMEEGEETKEEEEETKEEDNSESSPTEEAPE